MHTKERSIHRVFLVSLFLKGLNSLVEIFAGTVLFFTGTLTSVVSTLIHGELIEDPTDFIATHIQNALPYFSTHSQLYASVYLLSHGIIKIVLVGCLLRNKLWAYPATIGVLSLFVVYQIYRLWYGYSLVLVLLTLFDLLILGLTWHEYRLKRLRVTL